MKNAVSFSLVLVVITFCVIGFIHFVRQETLDTAQRAAEAVKQVLHLTPEVTVTTYVVRQKNTDILELASTSKEFPLDYHYKTKFLGSEKFFDIKSDYIAKAGFDLRDKFTVQVDENTKKLRAFFPPPRLLSCQQKAGSFKILRDQDGWLNGVTPEERQRCINEMNADAERKAIEMNILEEAKESVRKQLMELAKKSGQDWEVHFSDEMKTLPPL